MKTPLPKLLIPLVILILSGLACSLPGISAPTPFVFPTPDLTMTALFNPTLEPSTTITSSPPMPATVTQSSNSSPTPTSNSSSEPTSTSVQPTSVPTSTPVITQSSAGPGMRPRNSVAGIYFDSPPNIDGNFSEWGLDTYAIDSVVYGSDKRRNPGDLSGSMMIGWDETYLYVAVRVRDDQYVQNASGEMLFKGDSIEILLDTEVSEDYFVRSLNNDDFQLGISPGSPEISQDPEAYLWFPRSMEGSRSKVKVGADNTDNGYRIECAIPWTIFDIDPHENQHFGFAVSISDNDKVGDVVQQSMASNVPTRMLTDPTTWGDLTLINR